MPVARDTEGRTLPRAYVARRRSPSPRAVPVSPSHTESPPEAEPVVAEPRPIEAPTRIATTPPAPPGVEAHAPAVHRPAAVKPLDVQAAGGLQLRHVIYLLVVLAAIAIGISAGVALFVNRSLKSPPASSGTVPNTPR